MNGNVGSVVKQNAKTTGHNIHPNYANIISETGVKIKDKRLFLFLESLHSFLDKKSVNERAPFPRVYASLVSSLRNNEHWGFCYIFAFHDLQSTRPQKAIKNSVLMFLDVQTAFLEFQSWAQIAPTVLTTKFGCGDLYLYYCLIGYESHLDGSAKYGWEINSVCMGIQW